MLWFVHFCRSTKVVFIFRTVLTYRTCQRLWAPSPGWLGRCRKTSNTTRMCGTGYLSGETDNQRWKHRFFLPSIDIFGLWLITDAFHSGSSVSCSQYCMGNSFYSCNDVFCHHYSAVQVDVFTVVYKKFDSLVSGGWKFPRPAVLTRETSL